MDFGEGFAMRRLIISGLLFFASAACVHGQGETPGQVDTAQASHHYDTLAFVQAGCGGCHAVEGNDLSPNPQAPRFIDIANREWLTRETLATWLADAHNYPEMMDFDLEREQVDDIAGYLFAMRDKDYRRMPD